MKGEQCSLSIMTKMSLVFFAIIIRKIRSEKGQATHPGGWGAKSQRRSSLCCDCKSYWIFFFFYLKAHMQLPFTVVCIKGTKSWELGAKPQLCTWVMQVRVLIAVMLFCGCESSCNKHSKIYWLLLYTFLRKKRFGGNGK